MTRILSIVKGFPSYYWGIGWPFLIILLVGSVFIEPETANQTIQVIVILTILVIILAVASIFAYKSATELEYR